VGNISSTNVVQESMRQPTVPLTLVILVLVLAACASPQRIDPVSNTEADCSVPNFATPANSQPTSYFPAGLFQPDNVRDGGLVEWYSRSLHEMAEPSFQSIKTTDVESYRFLWLRSFHPGVAVRVWKGEKRYCLSVKQLDGVDKYFDRKFVPSAKLAINRSRSLTVAEWNGFIARLERAHFWSLPAVDNGPMAEDGAEWLLEGAKESQYHVIARQSPASGDYYQACLLLLQLSELKVDASKGELY